MMIESFLAKLPYHVLRSKSSVRVEIEGESDRFLDGAGGATGIGSEWAVVRRIPASLLVVERDDLDGLGSLGPRAGSALGGISDPSAANATDDLRREADRVNGSRQGEISQYLKIMLDGASFLIITIYVVNQD